jgi:hypothetical protein
MRELALIRVARDAAAHFNGSDGFPNNGRKNVYECEFFPGHRMVTIDREPGVTPFLITCERCKAAGMKGSSGMLHPVMRSSCYQVDQALEPTHEWYRPDTCKGLDRATTEHVMKGGLLLRKIETEEKSS